MSEKLAEIILEELFKLSGKIDKIQEEMKGMATKEDLKAFATKEDIKDMATKEDLKAFATKEDFRNLEKRMDKRFEEQTQDISEMFHDSYKYNAKKRKELEEKITKLTGICN